jgi:phosphoglycerate dehydrogenase-like enzyme
LSIVSEPPSGGSVRPFRIAFTGDFLDAEGRSAYGDIGISLLDTAPHVRYRFLTDQAPTGNDPEYYKRFYSLEVTAGHIADIDGLVVLRPWVKRHVFATGARNLVVIGRSGAGYDKIDIDACTENDVALFNAPMALNHATASTALLFMLALAKRLPQQDRLARLGRWDLQTAEHGHEIEGRTLGIVGLGHSGRELVRLVTPFRMRIFAYSPHADPTQAAALGVQLKSLDEVFREADFVSVHSHLTPQKHRMILAEHLRLMKPTAYFVNVARGELVDQEALVKVLHEKRIAGAALDVFEYEPLPADDPLTKLDNVIITPHWNCSTTDVWRATGQAMAEGMLRASRGEMPENVVNREVLERRGFREKLARFEENRT